MKSKGFTLIELLAVIVILAIIALIATPIVLNIISDSKESATLQSAEFYLGAVETAVAQKIIDEPAFKPTICDIQSDGNLKCDGIDVEVEIKGETPTSGTIILENGKIKDVELLLSEKTIIKNSDGKLEYGEAKPKEKTLDTICTYDSASGIAEKTVGAKYSCEVKDGTSYNFYVLTTPQQDAETIDLIMDRNICQEGKTCFVAWNNESGQGTNQYGPVTALNYLYDATKDWVNVEPVNYTYSDKTTQGGMAACYISFVSTNGIAVLTQSSWSEVTIGSESEPLRVRMPIYSSDASKTEIVGKTNAEFLYYNYTSGYWTLSSQSSGFNNAWYVSSANISSGGVISTAVIGVRPVITLKI